ncbi:MAG: phosphoribosylformylglycinamidine synthase subunit PurL [Planctomycetota bacterium]
MEAWCVEVAVREPWEDPAAAPLAERLAALGLELSGRPLPLRGYLLPGRLPEAAAERAGRELLADPISDDFRVFAAGGDAAEATNLWPGYAGAHRLVVRRLPGVMDPVARSAREALDELGIEADVVATYRSWLLPLAGGDAAARDRLAAIGRELANEVIEEVLVDALPPGLPDPGRAAREGRVEVPIAGLGDDALRELSERGCLSLNLAEMRAIQAHFDGLGRAPTLTELETLAQTWSEHCKHKTLTGNVVFRDETTGETREYGNLLRETIAAVTTELDRPWCVSVFVDNAGVVDLDGRDCLCIKVETHNHPSAIEPFGGAGTGVGGVIRDILGTGLGARPLCNLDVFCVAPPDHDDAALPPGTLHPARVLDGVVAGVRDYGNPMGIPTVTGAVHFDEGFVGNPLVYCGTVGILPRSKVFKAAEPGDLILCAGGRTGRDGIHGATFSSVELHEESETVSSGAVQIGDPITEKKVADAMLEARDRNLYHAVTDCGAGGFSSAVGEMGEKVGASVELSTAPLKYAGLTPTEIWISEAQERMVFAVPPAKVEAFREVFAKYEVETAVLGEFTGDGRLRIAHEGKELCDLDMGFLHDGVPRLRREAVWRGREPGEPVATNGLDLGAELTGVLGDLAVCSREWITRQYDHEVQGMSAAKPFAGPRQRGPGDGAVLAPSSDSPLGFAVGTGLNPRYSRLDPAAMAEAALDEAMRNVVVKGGDPGQCAILDNYCWGNPERPETLGALVRATEAVCALARAYGTPFVSGKDSLYNEYRVGGQSLAIPGCLLVTALAPVADVTRVPDSALTGPGRGVFLVGVTRDELGGSVLGRRQGRLGRGVPRLHGPEACAAAYRALHEAIGLGLVTAAHDLSEGGLGAAAAEMAFGGECGLLLDLAAVPAEGALDDATLLFSESLGRVLVEAAAGAEAELMALLGGRGVTVAKVGESLAEPLLRVDGTGGERVVELDLDVLERAWREPLARGPLALAPRRQA